MPRLTFTRPLVDTVFLVWDYNLLSITDFRKYFLRYYRSCPRNKIYKKGFGQDGVKCKFRYHKKFRFKKFQSQTFVTKNLPTNKIDRKCDKKHDNGWDTQGKGAFEVLAFAIFKLALYGLLRVKLLANSNKLGTTDLQRNETCLLDHCDPGPIH